MSRSRWKSPYIDKKIIENIKNEEKKKTKVKRNLEILPIFLGKKVTIHNGKQNNDFEITEEMLGYKFGELFSTRKKYIYKKKKKKKKKK